MSTMDIPAVTRATVAFAKHGNALNEKNDALIESLAVFTRYQHEVPEKSDLETAIARARDEYVREIDEWIADIVAAVKGEPEKSTASHCGKECDCDTAESGRENIMTALCGLLIHMAGQDDESKDDE